MRYLVFMGLISLCYFEGFGQQFNTALGLRFSDDLALNFAQRIGQKATFQVRHDLGILSDHPVTAIHLAAHMPLITKRLNMFVGGGSFASFNYSNNDDPAVRTLGPSMLIGADVTFGRLNISVDWSPQLALGRTNDRRFNATSGISLRYVILPRKSKFKSWRVRTADRFRNIFKKKKD